MNNVIDMGEAAIELMHRRAKYPKASRFGYSLGGHTYIRGKDDQIINLMDADQEEFEQFMVIYRMAKELIGNDFSDYILTAVYNIKPNHHLITVPYFLRGDRPKDGFMVWDHSDFLTVKFRQEEAA